VKLLDFQGINFAHVYDHQIYNVGLSAPNVGAPTDRIAPIWHTFWGSTLKMSKSNFVSTTRWHKS